MIRLDRTRRWLRQLGTALEPSDLAWRGATTALVLVAALVLAGAFANDVLQDFAVEKLAAFAVWIVALLAAGALGLLVLAWIQRLPRRFRWSLLLFAPLVVLFLAPHDEWQGIAVPSVLLLLASLIGGSLGVLLGSGRPWKQQRMAVAALATGLAALAVGLYAVFGDKESANPLLDDYVLEDRTLTARNPGIARTSRGPHADLRQRQGPPSSRVRRQGRTDLASVDGSKLIDNWDGFSGWLSTRYWGFDATALPLQARVWYPAATVRSRWCSSCTAITRWRISRIPGTPTSANCSPAAASSSPRSTRIT